MELKYTRVFEGLASMFQGSCGARSEMRKNINMKIFLRYICIKNDKKRLWKLYDCAPFVWNKSRRTERARGETSEAVQLKAGRREDEQKINLNLCDSVKVVYICRSNLLLSLESTKIPTWMQIISRPEALRELPFLVGWYDRTRKFGRMLIAQEWQKLEKSDPGFPQGTARKFARITTQTTGLSWKFANEAGNGPLRE